MAMVHDIAEENVNFSEAVVDFDSFGDGLGRENWADSCFLLAMVALVSNQKNFHGFSNLYFLSHARVVNSLIERWKSNFD